MATQDDVKRIALSLPGTAVGETQWGFSIDDGKKSRGWIWLWKERIHPKKARVPNPQVIALRTADIMEKEMLLTSDEEVFFTEPHYDGYPAVLVRLPAVRVSQLRTILIASWRGLAARAIVEAFDAKPTRKPPRTAKRATKTKRSKR
jgi:hypothetical protein